MPLIERKLIVELADHRRFFRDELDRMCARATPPLTAREVLDRHRKTPPIAAMRAQFAKKMRELVGQRGQDKSRRYRYFEAGRPNDWHPISTPVLAEFLNLHYTTIVLALQRLAKLEAAEAAKALTAAAETVAPPPVPSAAGLASDRVYG